jgi:hypothetical protein
MSRFKFGILCILLAYASVASAQLYKWTGPDGKIQYSDKLPPAGTKYEKIKQDVAPEVKYVPPAAVSPATTAQAPAVAPKPAGPEVGTAEWEAQRLKKEKADFDARKKIQDLATKQKKERADNIRKQCELAQEEVKRTNATPVSKDAAAAADRTDKVNAAKTQATSVCGA